MPKKDGTLTKRERRGVVKLLTKGRELMNDKGRHWLRRRLKERINWSVGSKETPEYGYCAIGSLNAAGGFKQTYGSARFAGGRTTVFNDPVLDEAKFVLAEAIAGYRPGGIEEAESIIVRFNDSSTTTWGDVSRKFRTAARRAEKAVEG